ncbi:MAG: hypothetical protein CML06_14580 [Pseudomonadales bacterium]|nr:hypothetical protein [Pseudomonadales bacterium]
MLFLTHEATPNLQWRLGRMQSSHYLFSSTIDVGYAYPWARPPVDAYSYLLGPLKNLDGADLLYTHDLTPELELDIQLLAGYAEGELLDVEVKAEPSYGTTLTLRATDWQLRYSFHLDKTSIQSDDLDTAVELYSNLGQTVDPIFGEIGEFFISTDSDYQYHALGAQWEGYPWGLIAEKYLVRPPREEGFANRSEGWYVSALYHYGAFTPYVSYGAYKNVTNKELIPLLNQALENPNFSAFAPLLQLNKQLIEQFEAREQSLTLGLRYDFHTQACLKAEVQYFNFQGGTTGQAYPEGDSRPGSATMFTVV